MNTAHIKSDSLYTPIIFAIESRIVAADKEAKAEGISLTDSQVRSVLNRVRKSAAVPDPGAGARRDQILADLQGDLAYFGTHVSFEDEAGERIPVSTQEWHLCLRTVEDSIRVRSLGPGSRGYLEFITDFVAKAKESAL